MLVAAIEDYFAVTKGRHMHRAAQFLRAELGRELGDIDLLPLPPVADELAAQFDLDTTDARILVVLHIIDKDSEMSNALGPHSDRALLHILAGMCGVGVVEFSRRTRSGGRLSRLGLIERHRKREDVTGIELTAPVTYSFVSDTVDDLAAEVFAAERTARFAMEDFAVPHAERRYMSAALSAGGSVLIVGEPGIGKTEFAHALAESMGRRVREVSTDTSAVSLAHMRTGRDRLVMIGMAQNFVTDDEILVVDEADAVIRSATGIFALPGQSGSFDKAEINSLIDELSVPSIWVTNSAGQVPASVLRRFTHVYRFPHPDVETRERMLSHRLADLPVPTGPDTLRHIARSYDLTPSAVDRLSTVLGAAPDDDGSRGAGGRHDAAIGTSGLMEYLRAASRGPMRDDFRPLVAPHRTFAPDLCNMSLPPEEVTTLADRGRSNGRRALRLLFDGPPGGGKTQFALYLAAELGLETMVRRPSDLLSPYVGVSEQLIAEMFREAEDRQAVLIIDEADALLSDRAGAQRSWELTRAAEFLQGIGEFEGLLIACTNRIEAVDPAVRRRFHHRVSFGPLLEESLERALSHLFPVVSFGAEDLRRLESGPPLMMSDLALAAEMMEADANDDTGACPPARVVNDILANARSRDMQRGIGFAWAQ